MPSAPPVTCVHCTGCGERSAPRYASIDAAAKYIQANPRTIRQWIAQSRLSGYRVGPRLIRVDLNEVDALMRPIPAGGAA